MTSLVKKIDDATKQHSDARMGSFVVFCNDSDNLEKQLKDLAGKEKIEKTVLTIDNPTGPSNYHIAKDADVTVLLYVNKTVKANFAFRKGELNDQKIEDVLGALPKILDKSK